MDGPDPKDTAHTLADCERQLEQLQRENKLLREAAGTFADLAERLNASLDSERRREAERRARPRESTDRRALDGTADRSGS